MALNKLALIRYKSIDDCLKNRFRKWTLDDLIEKVSQSLYEYEGITSGVSKRTIQADIQLMRSNKLGYNAPIIVTDRKFYSYEDPKYSISNAPINEADINKMQEIVSVLKHMNGFNYFDQMNEMIAKLENNLNRNLNKTKNCIQFENNNLLRGIEHVYPLYKAILNKTPLLIEYKSFKAQESHQGIYYPYLLKEYRNRWFLITKNKKGNSLLTLALDRIIEFQELIKESFIEYQGVDFDKYFSEVLGVTKNEKDRPQKIILKVDSTNAPYVITKPLHHTQTILKEEKDYSLFRIDVVINFELEREILGFGENLSVVSPRLLRSRIERRLKKAINNYNN